MSGYFPVAFLKSSQTTLIDSAESSFMIPSSTPKSKKFFPLTAFSLSDTVLQVASSPEKSFELSVDEFKGNKKFFS